jgi:hypothetical protein
VVRDATPSPPRAGPSRKRRLEVIDLEVDSDEEQRDEKPDNKDLLKTRVGWLEVSDPSSLEAGALPVDISDNFKTPTSS